MLFQELIVLPLEGTKRRVHAWEFIDLLPKIYSHSSEMSRQAPYSVSRKSQVRYWMASARWGGDGVRAGEVRYGAGDAEDAVVAPRGEAHGVIGVFHEARALGAEGAAALELARAHVGVAVGTGAGKAGALAGSGGVHALFYLARGSASALPESSA